MSLTTAVRGALQRKDTTNSPAEGSMADVQKRLTEMMDQVKNFGEDVQKRVKTGETVTEELKAQTDKALSDMGELKQRLTELEQKAVRSPGPSDQPERKSLGQRFIEHESLKGMNSQSRKSFHARFDKKDITSGTGTVGTVTSPGTSLVPSDRVTGIIAPPQRRLTIRDLIMPGQTSQGAIEYPVETGFTNNAAPVAEGTAKPKSDLTFELKTAAVRTIAHYFKASRQIMDDFPALASYIDGRAEYGLLLKEEEQLLLGNGSGQNLLGIIPQAATFAIPAGVSVTGMTLIDRLRLAILQATLAEFPVNGFVLNPIDWASIELTKDSEGRYIIAQPVNGSPSKLWNQPVVETQSMPQDQFLTGAFNLGAQLFDRMAIEVLMSTENEDDFIKNMVTIRAEERLALAVYRPEAFVTGTLSGAGSSD